MGSPQINIPALSGQPQQNRPNPLEIDSPKKPDMTESNVKRARLLLEKKKKQFENQSQDPNQTFQNSFDERQNSTSGAGNTMNAGLMIGNGSNNTASIGFPTEAGKPIMAMGGNLVCVPGITYKSMLPAQVA